MIVALTLFVSIAIGAFAQSSLRDGVYQTQGLSDEIQIHQSGWFLYRNRSLIHAHGEQCSHGVILLSMRNVSRWRWPKMGLDARTVKQLRQSCI